MSSPAAFPAVAGTLFLPPSNTGNPARRPFATMTAGAGALVGGPGGVAIGYFGFAHVDGTVTNAFLDPTDRIGVSIPVYVTERPNTWQRNFYDEETDTLRAREGTEICLLTRGAVWVRFNDGAFAGQPVYASTLDGRAISGYADNAILTPWVVGTSTPAGGLAVITTFSQVATQ